MTHSPLLQVLFNLANQYHANRMHEEAHKTYLLIVKNKLFGSGGKCHLWHTKRQSGQLLVCVCVCV